MNGRGYFLQPFLPSAAIKTHLPSYGQGSFVVRFSTKLSKAGDAALCIDYCTDSGVKKAAIGIGLLNDQQCFVQLGKKANIYGRSLLDFIKGRQDKELQHLVLGDVKIPVDALATEFRPTLVTQHSQSLLSDYSGFG